jgi:hypothetical protein
VQRKLLAIRFCVIAEVNRPPTRWLWSWPNGLDMKTDPLLPSDDGEMIPLDETTFEGCVFENCNGHIYLTERGTVHRTTPWEHEHWDRSKDLWRAQDKRTLGRSDDAVEAEVARAQRRLDEWDATRTLPRFECPKWARA